MIVEEAKEMRASAIIMPQLGVPGFTPKPMKLSAAIITGSPISRTEESISVRSRARTGTEKLPTAPAALCGVAA